MEYLNSEGTLKSVVKNGDDDGATRILCETIRGLHSETRQNQGFTPISELLRAFHFLRGKLDKQLVSKAESLYQQLAQDTKVKTVLHGDLHHDNILLGESGWKAIDPHGYYGDPTFEVGAMIYNSLEFLTKKRDLPEIIERRIKTMTENLPFDPERIRAWTFCRTILSLGWSAEDHGVLPELEIEIAQVIGETLRDRA